MLHPAVAVVDHMVGVLLGHQMDITLPTDKEGLGTLRVVLTHGIKEVAM